MFVAGRSERFIRAKLSRSESFERITVIARFNRSLIFDKNGTEALAGTYSGVSRKCSVRGTSVTAAEGRKFPAHYRPIVCATWKLVVCSPNVRRRA